MKEITINGVAYVPASSLTKEFRYTTDYIGQLCRAKKVDAQLVGRSWYVNPLSLKAHKEGRYAKDVIENEAKVVSKTSISRLDVEMPESKLAKKVETLKGSNFARRIEWQPIKYEEDDEELLPPVKREIAPQRIAIDLADSVDISIKTSSTLTNLEAEELPTVSLKGKVNVTSLNESFETEDSNDIPEVPFEALVPLKPLENNNPVIHHSALPHRSQSRIARNTIKPQLEAATISPVQVVTEVAVAEEGDSGVQVIEITLVSTVGILSICLLLLFFGEVNIEATATSYQTGIQFSTDSLTAVLSLFSS